MFSTGTAELRGETGEPAIPEDEGEDGTPPAGCPRRPVGIEEAASKHLSTIKVSGHRKTRGLSGNQGLLR